MIIFYNPSKVQGPAGLTPILIVMKFGIRVILHLWNFDLSSILAFMITACNYCEHQFQKSTTFICDICCLFYFFSLFLFLFPGTSFAMLFERVELNKSPDKWRVQKIITSGAAFGSYIVLTTAIFYRVARTANPFAVSAFPSDER